MEAPPAMLKTSPSRESSVDFSITMTTTSLSSEYSLINAQNASANSSDHGSDSPNAQHAVKWNRNIEEDIWTSSKLSSAWELLEKYGNDRRSRLVSSNQKHNRTIEPKSILRRSAKFSKVPLVVQDCDQMSHFSYETSFSVQSMVEALNRESKRMNRKRSKVRRTFIS